MPLADDKLTYAVIGSSRRVYNTLGYGLLETAYAGALVHECRKQGLDVQREVLVPLYYDRTVVANYRMDIVVESRLIIEVKAVPKLRPEHLKQLFHYLRATNLEVALLLNFGSQPEVRRLTFRNQLKQYKGILPCI